MLNLSRGLDLQARQMQCFHSMRQYVCWTFRLYQSTLLQFHFAAPMVSNRLPPQLYKVHTGSTMQIC